MCDTECVRTPFLSGDVDHESYFFKKKNKLPLSAQIWAQRVRRSFFHESGALTALRREMASRWVTQVNQRSQTILMSRKKRVAKSTHCFSSVKPQASHDALPLLFMCQKPYTDSAAPLLFPSSKTFQPCPRNPSVVQGLFRVQVLWGCSRSFGMVQLGGGGTRRCVCGGVSDD